MWRLGNHPPARANSCAFRRADLATGSQTRPQSLAFRSNIAAVHELQATAILTGTQTGDFMHTAFVVFRRAGTNKCSADQQTTKAARTTDNKSAPIGIVSKMEVG